MITRAKRRVESGVVISNKMDKTITVSVSRLVKHKKYEKFIHRITKYKAHDKNSEAKMGDKVEIIETHPLSKTKRWRLLKIIEKNVE